MSTWIRIIPEREDQQVNFPDAWHLQVETYDGTDERRAACGLILAGEFEEVDQEAVVRGTACFNCYNTYLRQTQPEISSEPLEGDYEPMVMDPSHVSVRLRGAEEAVIRSMKTPAIDPDQERAAYVAGWLASASSTDEKERSQAVRSYLVWIANGRP